MRERTKQLTALVTPSEKEAVRESAAARGESMSSFVRNQVLDGVPVEEPPNSDANGKRRPLDDFMTARIRVDEDADPLPKGDVYAGYVQFCRDQYPNHDIESQHKVSRSIAELNAVSQGRAYVENEAGELTQKRCFLNVRPSSGEFSTD